MIDFSKIEQYRENNRIEAKKALGGLPKSIWETYSAFANTHGGIILLGVEELADKSFRTVDLPDPEKLIKEFWDIVNNPNKTSVNILSSKDLFVQEVDGNHIVVINVPRAERSYKPVYVDGNPLCTYRRNGEGDYRCTKEEYQAMVRDASVKTQDMLILEEMDMSVFNKESVRSYRQRMRLSRPGHVWESLEDEDFLLRLGAVGIGSDGKKHPTSAGLLMFGNEYDIVREFNSYFLDYQEQYDADTRWTDRIISSSGDWSGNVYDFYFRVYNKLIQDIKVPFKMEGGTRVDDTNVHKALREALANCLVHADYYGRQGLVIIKKRDSITMANPELIEGQASRALFKYYKQHGYTIAQKTEMIMTNFLENCRYQIGGKGKAMVVADSRANAVRYYLAIKKYLADHADQCVGCDVMVAFSGEVTLDDYPSEKPFTEATMNLDENGKYITTDKKFRKAFHSSQYNILVVANKYQTGFDEPLLHTMYVDKKLRDVTAVQTLSRLNRTAFGKNSTFVLDFENTEEDIKGAFLPYYETTTLEGSTDLNQVYDLRNKIRDFMLYNFDDVETFNKFMATQAGKDQDAAALGRLAGMFRPVIARYMDLSEDDRYSVRDYVRKFNKAYAFVTQLVRLHDRDLFNEYQYTLHLVRLLPRSGGDEFVDIEDKIKLEYASLTETFRGAIVLDEKPPVFVPGGSTAPKVPNKKKDTLQSIIDKVNERFSGNFTDADRVIIEGIYQMFMKDSEVKKFRKYAKDNSTEMFVRSLFPDKFRDIVTQCFLDNNDSFAKLFNDPDFYQKVQEAMAQELYKALRKE